jgi:hypothetical protein
MTVNKVAEMVELFGPTLYHRNPVRQVNPREMPMLPPELFGDTLMDPNAQMVYQQTLMQVQQGQSIDQARALLLQSYLNYTPTALDLKTESRWAIDEALIKGLGLLYTELYTPEGSPGMKMVGSFFDSVDNLVVDPDGESLNECKWIARRCVHPVWQVEDDYGLPRGTLKGNIESYNRQAEVASDRDGDYNRKRGLTNDLIVYWKIFSKMGLGGLLSVSGATTPGTVAPDTLQSALAAYGDNVYLVVANDVAYPLNLPDEFLYGNAQQPAATDQDVMGRVQWPTPFWADGTWPFTPISFHWVPRCVWPMSHLKPGLGELKFINWAYSMLAGKIRVACRDFIGIAKSLGEEVKDQIKHGQDYTIIEVEALHDSIDKVVKFLQHPGFQSDIYTVIKAVEDNFEKRVGLTELMYGMSAVQLRSAEEANIKGNAVSVRPDDMANKVEDAMTEVARKEALAARWHLQPQDVAPILGPLGAQWWQQLVMATDPATIIHQLEYRIEAGSARKPNKDRAAANMTQAMQNLFPTLWTYATLVGDVNPVNRLITDWAKSIDLDPSGYLMQPPPPAPVEPPGDGGSSPAKKGAA